MNISFKSLAVASVIGAAALASTPADAARVSIGVGIGVPIGGYAYGPGYYGPGYWGPGYWGPSYYYAPGAYVVEAPPRLVQSAPVAQAPASPDPIFYPNQGQTVAQTEIDRQACNRWATGQPSAMGDAGIFQRATYACMEGRGYTVK